MGWKNPRERGSKPTFFTYYYYYYYYYYFYYLMSTTCLCVSE
jgi:hypothetical protein